MSNLFLRISVRRCVLLVAACFAVSVGPAAALTGDPVEVNVILPLTGPAALLGQGLQSGLQMLERYVNGPGGGIRNRPLRFNFLDDQTNPQVAVQLTSGLLNKAQVILGGGTSASCKATAPLIMAKGPVLYCVTPAFVPPKGSYAFSAYVQTKDLLQAQVRYFRDRGWTRIGYLNSTDASGQEADASIDGIFALPENHTMQMVARELFNATDISVGAQIAKIKAANPQALIVWGSGSAAALALHGIHDAGLDLPVGGPGSLMLYSAMHAYASFLPKTFYIQAGKWPSINTIGSGPVHDVIRQFYAITKENGVLPDIGNNLAWDPALIIIDALRTLGPDAKAAEIRDFILQLHGFPGTNGYYDFRTGDQRGIGLKDVIVTLWSPSANAWVPVSTSGGAALPAARQPTK